MTLTDEQLAVIEARLEAATPRPWDRNTVGEIPAHFIRRYDGMAFLRVTDLGDAELIAHAPTDIRALLTEVTALRHDVTRHMEIANEHLAEVERLRSHITAARSFRVLNENGQADRHLSEAMDG